jgi:hypothetical protein
MDESGDGSLVDEPGDGSLVMGFGVGEPYSGICIREFAFGDLHSKTRN